MTRIWAKTILHDKITRSFVLSEVDKFSTAYFFDYLAKICHELDIPTPVILKTHANHFEQFNIVRFKTNDFVESIDFEVLVLENASE